MHEAEQHRHFVKRLHTLIHSELAENERADQARSAVLTYAAALNEAAVVAPQGELRVGAYIALHLTKAQNWLVDENLMLADITVATAFAFTQLFLADFVPAARYPALGAFCRRAEALSEFRAAPCRDGVKVAPPVATA